MRFLPIVLAAVGVSFLAQCRSLALPNVRDADNFSLSVGSTRIKLCQEKKSAAYVGMLRNVRIHRDASQDVSSPTWIQSSVSVNSVNSPTDEKTSSNIPQRLKDLIASYEETVAKLVKYTRKMCKNTNDYQRQMNFQTQLESLVAHVLKEQSKVRNAYAKLSNFAASTSQVPSKILTIENANNLRDLLDTVKELDVVYQDGEVNDEHVRIKRANDGYKVTASFVASGREEQIIQMLFDIQRQLTQIRKYLDKLCKHHSTWTATTTVNSVKDVSPADQPKEVPIIQN